MWERWSRVRNHASPEGYALRTAFNLANSAWRRKAAERRANARSAAPDVVAVPETADAVAVRSAVASLPKRQREAIVWRYFLGATVAETAYEMSCATGTVKALTSQAITSLRSAGLATEEGEEHD